MIDLIVKRRVAAAFSPDWFEEMERRACSRVE